MLRFSKPVSRIKRLRATSLLALEVEVEWSKTFASYRRQLNSRSEGSKSLSSTSDNKPSALTNSQRVRVLQWDRYCLENYLLDEDVMFYVLKGMWRTADQFPAVVSNDLKDIALSQITEMTIRAVYKRIEPENAGLRFLDSTNGSLSEIAGILAKRLESIAGQLRQSMLRSGPVLSRSL